jgi:hypothetical protein
MTSGNISRLWVLFCGRAPEDVNCVRTRNMPCSLHGHPLQLTLNVPGDVEQLSQLKCCYSYDALVQLADLLRCNPSERSSLQESAQDTRRAACQDLLRQKKASFIYDVLLGFELNAAGHICAAASANSVAARVPAASSPLQLLIPRELAVFVISAAALSLHASQATFDRYDCSVSPDEVLDLLQDAGY